jgi:serine/threonine protein kinase
VAIKMLAPEHAANASGLARFVREANAIARLTHPNIVQLIDFRPRPPAATCCW